MRMDSDHLPPNRERHDEDRAFFDATIMPHTIDRGSAPDYTAHIGLSDFVHQLPIGGGLKDSKKEDEVTNGRGAGAID